DAEEPVEQREQRDSSDPDRETIGNAARRLRRRHKQRACENADVEQRATELLEGSSRVGGPKPRESGPDRQGKQRGSGDESSAPQATARNQADSDGHADDPPNRDTGGGFRLDSERPAAT